MTKNKLSEPQVVAYNLTEAAGELGVSVTQVRRLLKQGRLVLSDRVRGGEVYVTAESVAGYKRVRKGAGEQ